MEETSDLLDTIQRLRQDADEGASKGQRFIQPRTDDVLALLNEVSRLQEELQWRTERARLYEIIDVLARLYETKGEGVPPEEINKAAQLAWQLVKAR